MSDWLIRVWCLLIAHAFTDYVWQSEQMGYRKDPTAFPPETSKYGPWWWHLSAHSLINAGGVLVATGHLSCSLGEFIVHWLTDYAKCRQWVSTNVDQGVHLFSKGVWAWISMS